MPFLDIQIFLAGFPHPVTAPSPLQTCDRLSHVSAGKSTSGMRRTVAASLGNMVSWTRPQASLQRLRWAVDLSGAAGVLCHSPDACC